ncbi:hypothetical protein [Streptomyces luteireticuli]|uniref:hypothetical protein n=1 Tax=Streptomyces luteireticuli TaxID=173858 RepID=UPI003556CFCC
MTGTDSVLWTLDEVRNYLGLATPNGARTALSRWGVRPVARQPGRSGQNLYSPEEVRKAHATRPGRGARTDLKRSE